MPSLSSRIGPLDARRISIVLAFCAPALTPPLARAAEPGDTPTVQEIVARISRAAKGVASWTADFEMTSSTEGGKFSARGSVQSKGPLKTMTMRMNFIDQSMTIRTVLDKDQVMWTEIDVGANKAVSKIDLKEEKELAAAAGLPGMGSISGSDLAGSAADLIEDLKATHVLTYKGLTGSGGEFYLLEAVAKDTAKGVAAGTIPPPRLVEVAERVRLTVGAADGLPRLIEHFGPNGPPTVTVRYRNVKLNPPLSNEAFVYTPPPDAFFIRAGASPAGLGGSAFGPPR